jgi:hypothetical protein
MRFSSILILGLGCFTALPGGQPEKSMAAGVIRVQVTGELLTSARKVGDAKEWTFEGRVHAGGRELFLDCSASKAAQQLLKAAHGDPGAPKSWVVLKKVRVEGRLEFLPYLRYDEKGKQIEHTDTLPVIVVESLKIIQ